MPSKSNRLPPRRSRLLKTFVDELAQPPVQRYVELQRTRGLIHSIGKVDVDVEQLVERSFLCDRHRCIQWSPHESRADARPLIDRSCCARYDVPVTDLDRKQVDKIFPLVKKRLPKDHPYNQEPDATPFEVDEEYSLIMREREDGACHFVIYEKGETFCAIHRTCLEEKLDVWTYKPLSCSLWPIALVDYEADGKERYLLTAYVRATHGLFESDEEDAEENHFACLVDQDPSYEPLYRSVEGIVTHLLGADFYRALDRYATKHQRKKA